MKSKVVIIGCGNVGLSYAYALINQHTFVTDLVLVDINEEKVQGDVMDLSHGLPFSPSKINVSYGTYADCNDAKIVCICAGANQKEGETRLDLIKKNYSIFKDLVPKVMNSGFNGIFLVVTNPVDAMSYLTYRLSGMPSNKVIGSGTVLDTSRLKYLIGKKLDINPSSVHAYVLGEHGDSEFIPWSRSTLGLQDIHLYLKDEELSEIEEDVRNAAYEVIKKKGVTNYGIGMCLVKITDAILSGENSILCVSAYHEKENVYISTPSVLNQNGVRELVLFPLNETEEAKLKNSMNVIKNSIAEVLNTDIGE